MVWLSRANRRAAAGSPELSMGSVSEYLIAERRAQVFLIVAMANEQVLQVSGAVGWEILGGPDPGHAARRPRRVEHPLRAAHRGWRWARWSWSHETEQEEAHYPRRGLKHRVGHGPGQSGSRTAPENLESGGKPPSRELFADVETRDLDAASEGTGQGGPARRGRQLPSSSSRTR